MELKTVNIKGKEYVEVSERIRYFRENYKEWSMITEWIKIDEKMAIAKAIIKNPAGVTIAEGTAMEIAGSTFINKTSHIENCETSAWGRALGNLGIGIEGSVATALEVANAIKNQEKKETASPQTIRIFENICKEYSINYNSILEYYGKSKLTDFTEDELIKIIDKLQEKHGK
jgi:hypothetical protein